MLTQIFESADKPFYRSSRTFNLGLIPEERYIEFCKTQFEANNKNIEAEAVSLVYSLFAGNTYMMQQTMNALYSYKEKGCIASSDDAKYIIEALVDEKSEDYKTFLHGLKPNYEKVLLCIASEGIAEGIFSGEIKTRYNLPSSSTVSNILKSFQDENSHIVEEISPNNYKLEDKFLELWAAKYIFDSLDVKFVTSHVMFEREKKLRKFIK